MAESARIERIVNWPLLPQPDPKGRLQFPTFEDSVRQSIQIILRTRPGERVMRPHFGGGLDTFIHRQNTLTTRREIAESITDALERWEKRIILDRVDVWPVDDRPATVRVEIAYRLRRSNQPRQLGITMELET